MVPFVDFYKKQIDYYNKTVHDILTQEIPLILPNVPKNRKEKRGIIASLVTRFYQIGVLEVSQAIYITKGQKALNKAFIAMGNQVNLQRKQSFSFKRFNGSVSAFIIWTFWRN